MNVKQHQYFKSIFSSLLAFVIALSSALYLEWTAIELMWSLWLGAFFATCIYILNIVISFLITGLYQTPLKNSKRKIIGYIKMIFTYIWGNAIAIGLIGGVISLFASMFFSLVYFALLTAAYMPNLEPELFTYLADFNFSLFFSTIYHQLFTTYFIIAIAAIINDYKNVFEPMVNAYKNLKERRVFIKNGNTDMNKLGAAGLLNGVRLYSSALILIKLLFTVFFIHLLKDTLIPDYVIFTLIFAFHFFPFGTFRAIRNEKEIYELRKKHNPNYK